MKRKLCFVNYLLSVFTLLQIDNCVTTAQNPEWVRKTDAPQGIAFPNQPPQLLNGEIYFLEGQDYLINKIITYDPNKDSWFSKDTELITNRHHFATAVFNDKFYVAGGCIGDNDSIKHHRTNSVEMYDPANGKWTSRKNMITPRAAFQMVTLEDKIYAIGGSDRDSIPIRTIEVYDPVKDSWMEKTIAPWKSSLVCWGASVYKGEIYILGVDKEGIAFTVFNPLSDTFISKSTRFMEGMNTWASVIDSDNIFVVGGSGEQPLQTVIGYNISKDQWSRYPDLPQARAYPGVVNVKGKIYCIGGIGPQWNWTDKNKSVFEIVLKPH